jgi:hypothetical protein
LRKDGAGDLDIMNKRKNTNDHIRQSLHTTGTLRYLVLGPGKPIIDGVYRASNDGKGLGFLLLFRLRECCLYMHRRLGRVIGSAFQRDGNMVKKEDG